MAPTRYGADDFVQKGAESLLDDRDRHDLEDPVAKVLDTDSEEGSEEDGNGDNQSICVAACTLAAAIPALIGSCCWPILVGAIFSVAAGNVNAGLVEFFHGVQVAIMLALMLNIVQFAWWSVKRDKTPMSHCARYTPVYIVMVSAVLIMVQPVSMLVIGSWESINNFFFDGAPFGEACMKNSDCGATKCMTDAYDCPGSTFPGSSFKIAPDCQQLDADHAGVNCAAIDPATNTTFLACACAMDTNALLPNTTIGWLIQVFCTYLGFIVMFTGVFMATKLHHKIARKWRNLRAAQKRGGKGRKKEYPRAQAATATVNGAPAGDEDECTTCD